MDSITEPRSKDTRESVYDGARIKIKKLVKVFEEYDLMTDEIRDTAFNTDYTAIKTLNDEFDRVDEIKVEEINNISAVQNAFD